MSIRFRKTTKTPFDVTKVFSFDEAAMALIFNRTGKYSYGGTISKTAYLQEHRQWIYTLRDAHHSEENPLKISYYEGDRKTPYIQREDLEDWYNKEGMAPGFLFEETESTDNNTTVSDDENKSTVIEEIETKRILGPIDQRIEIIIRVLSDAGYDLMSIPKGGKKKAMDECLKNKKIFSSVSVFETAWSVASKGCLLAIENKEKYMGN